MRILSIDPGSRRIGLAISDPTGTIANPLMVLMHESREVDADLIAREVLKNEVDLVIVGQSIDDNGEPTFEGRRAARLARALSRKVTIPVEFWNESFSTQEAKKARVMMGGSRRKRSGHLDDLAATVILQSYLDSLSMAKDRSG